MVIAVRTSHLTTLHHVVKVKVKVKVKWSRYRPGVAQRVGRDIALLFHDRCTRRGWVVNSKPRPHFTPGKESVPILQEVGWAPGPVWTGGKSCPHRDSIPDRPARSQSLHQLSYPVHTPCCEGTPKKRYRRRGPVTKCCNYRFWGKISLCPIAYLNIYPAWSASSTTTEYKEVCYDINVSKYIPVFICMFRNRGVKEKIHTFLTLFWIQESDRSTYRPS